MIIVCRSTLLWLIQLDKFTDSVNDRLESTFLVASYGLDLWEGIYIVYSVHQALYHFFCCYCFDDTSVRLSPNFKLSCIWLNICTGNKLYS